MAYKPTVRIELESRFSEANGHDYEQKIIADHLDIASEPITGKIGQKVIVLPVGAPGLRDTCSKSLGDKNLDSVRKTFQSLA